jgi:hypothetical protein
VPLGRRRWLAWRSRTAARFREKSAQLTPARVSTKAGGAPLRQINLNI